MKQLVNPYLPSFEYICRTANRMSLNFDVYDDRTVWLLIEYIRVMEEGKIAIMLKGGITIEERVE